MKAAEGREIVERKLTVVGYGRSLGSEQIYARNVGILFDPKLIRTMSGVLGIIQQSQIRILSSWKLFQKKIDFIVCSEFIQTQCDLTCTCVVARFHTCVDQMQTHSGKKRER